jgi:hypothetical protein
VINARQYRDPHARRACRKQYTQRLRIDCLVVGADKDQRLAVEFAQIVGIFEARRFAAACLRSCSVLTASSCISPLVTVSGPVT